MQLSPLGLSQGLVYTIPYITQQVWSTYTTNTPTIRVVNDVFRNMILVLRCCLRLLAEEQGHMSEESEMEYEPNGITSTHNEQFNLHGIIKKRGELNICWLWLLECNYYRFIETQIIIYFV